jgi:GTPase-activating protein SST2
MTDTATATFQQPHLMNILSSKRSRQSRKSSISNALEAIPSDASQGPCLQPTESHSSSSDSIQGTSPPPAPGSLSFATNPRHRRLLAAIAREKTSSALANLAAIQTSPAPSLNKSESSGSLARRSKGLSAGSKTSSGWTANGQPVSLTQKEWTTEPVALPRTPPEIDSTPAPPYQTLSPNSSPPIFRSANSSLERLPSPPPEYSPKGSYNKMHQTSSRLLRMTDEERPFTRVS